MASLNPDHDNEEPPVHQIGTLLQSPPDYTTIATFPPGSFLENLALRRNGTILVSDMLSGSIWYVDPRKFGETQETVELVHKFELEDSYQVNRGFGASPGNMEEDNHGSYASTPAVTAIVENPGKNGFGSDLFYVASGIHGKQGTWWLYELDMQSFTPKARSAVASTTEEELRANPFEAATATGRAKLTRVAPIPNATWLNGGTAIWAQPNTLILTAESNQGRIYSYNLSTKKVNVWLEHALLKKMTTRPPWPGVNGLEYNQAIKLIGPRWVYFTNSDRGILGRVNVIHDHSQNVEPEPLAGDVEVLATGCCGDDLCLDTHGNIYVATNPMNTVLKFPHIGASIYAEDLQTVSEAGAPPRGKTPRYDHRYKADSYGIFYEPEREVVLGVKHASGLSLSDTDPETTGPTSVSLGWPEQGRGDLYVVTNGGIIDPLDGVIREAKVLRVDLTAWE